MSRIDLAIGIGGAAGQGIATPGDILARIFVRRGLHVNAYNAYQSIIRGGHIFLTLRTSDQPVLSHGDTLDVLMPLNQDTMNRHLRLMRAGSAVLFNSDTIKPGDVPDGVQLCPFSVKALAPTIRGDLVQNTIALAAVLRLIGVEFGILEEILTLQFKRKGPAAVAENVGVARAGYDYAAAHFTAFPVLPPRHGQAAGVLRGQPGPGHGRRRRGRALLLRLSHEPFVRACCTGWRGTRASSASWFARSRTRSASSTWRSGRPMRAAAPCARPPGAASP